MEEKFDVVNRPKRYAAHPSGVECIDVAEHLGFCLGNAFKYVFRHKEKGNPIEDLRKAKWYLLRELEKRALENWAPLPSDKRYSVSTLGNIRFKGKDRNRKLVALKSGYLTFVSVDDSGKHVCRYVHRCVAEAFLTLGPIPGEMQVCHIDGNRQNNILSNLRVSTVKENHADKKFHGTDYAGEKNPGAALSPDEVEEIRLLKGTMSSGEAASVFGVSSSTVDRIWKNISWRESKPHVFILIEKIVDNEPCSTTGKILELIGFARWSKDGKVELELAVTLLDSVIGGGVCGKD